MNLAEKYRPKRWEDFVGQDKAIARAQFLIERGLSGVAIHIAGKSGTGKTSIARMMADSFADTWAIEELSADKTTLADLAECCRQCAYRPLGGRGRVFIINESHRLKAAVQGELLNVIDPVPEGVCWIFTTTFDGLTLFEDDIDAAPFLSRCKRIDMASRCDAKRTAEYLRTIAQAEGLDGQPVERYVRLVNDNRGNIRACLNAIDSGDLLV